ncbi:MAG TPA: AglZ/HisF2 family acetamidino modification protein [Candidatus Limiplasma sp.]|nr:AglZ/HisF2 family acetamidino modification protein [Candidatus Limiplasma sp.]
MFHRPRLIPCLLISDGNLVKTRKFKDPVYLGDPINAVKIFSEKCVDELCIQDIEASRKGAGPDFDLLSEIATEAFMPLSYGGGITTIEQIRRLFHIGFEKVILNTAWQEHPDLLREAAECFGSQSVVASIDVKQDVLRRNRCMTCDGTRPVEGTPVEMARRAQDAGAGEILLNSIDRDGAMQGYDLKLIKGVTDAVTVPVIACGGASGVQDMETVLHQAGAHAAAAGSMFVFYGPRKAVLIHVPEEKELFELGVYRDA